MEHNSGPETMTNTVGHDVETESVLVTGATGTVGEPLVHQLLDSDMAIRIATRNPEDAFDRFGEEPEYVDFDFDRPETWGKALKDVDKTFLLLPPGGDVSTIHEFADAADRVGVDHVVHLSIIGAEKIPILPHRRIEKHLTGTGMTHTYLRSSWFMQNLSEIHCPEIIEGDEIFIPAGDGELSLVDARDVAAVAATILTDSDPADQVYALTGPAALNFSEVAEVFSDVLERPIKYANSSPLAFGRHMYQRGFSLGFILFMTVEYSVVRLGYSGRITNDVERILDRSPRSVRKFVKDYADNFSPEGARCHASESGE